MKDADGALLKLAREELNYSETPEGLTEAMALFAEDKDAEAFIKAFEKWTAARKADPTFISFQNVLELGKYCRKHGIGFPSHYASMGGTEEYIAHNWRLHVDSSRIFWDAGISTTFAFVRDCLGHQTLTMLNTDQLRGCVGGDYRKIAQLWGDWFDNVAQFQANIEEMRGYYLLCCEMRDLFRGIR